MAHPHQKRHENYAKREMARDYNAALFRSLAADMIVPFIREYTANPTSRGRNVTLAARDQVDVYMHHCLPCIFSNVYPDIETRHLFIDAPHPGFHHVKDALNGV